MGARFASFSGPSEGSAVAFGLLLVELFRYVCFGVFALGRGSFPLLWQWPGKGKATMPP